MLFYAGFARAAQFKRSLAALVSATSIALLQTKQRLSVVGIFGNFDLLRSEDNSENGNAAKRTTTEMPVRPNYRAPRLPIVLCHGLFGFDKLGPSSIPYLQIHYWSGIEEALQKLGAKVVVTRVPRTGCIRARAQALHHALESILSDKCNVNLLAHSMGGLDCRCLISQLPTEKYIVRTLTTVATPHRGSPFMDWCRDNIGVGGISQTFEEAAKVVDDALKQMAEKTRDHQNPNDSRSSLSELRVQEQSLRSPSQAENIVNSRGIIVSTKSDKSESSNASNKKSFSIPISFNLPNFNLSLPNINLSNMNLSKINLSKINLFSLSSISQATYTILHPVTQSLIHAFDTPAYSNLTTDYCVNYFNKVTPNDPSVAYYSYGASTNVPFWSPLYFPHQIIKEKEGPNDGLVSVKSAQWGKYLGTVECDHWDLTNKWRIKIGSSFDPIEFYLKVATFLAAEGY
ncbi:13395_t:CDS:2 [Dentiscutata heterogama]|uniref:13395_t:CDS:1 n=1 Tax=Dentiscutata heterogama TaxID=1316150 RepID=A0ACA9M381_9GLOM|nr:13395_t:CDS:2 [Dentiscutata heterogama]